MTSFFRKVIDAASPEGPPHEPKEDGFYSKWRDATAINYEVIRQAIIDLKFVRDPSHTSVENLSNLELEVGITRNTNLTETQRRELLESEIFKKATTGNDDDLQTLLDKAGFDLTVYQNSPDGPAIDPAILIDQNFVMQANEGDHYAGNDNAYAGRIGGELLVNGKKFEQSTDPAYFGAGTMWAGNTNSVAGYFETLRKTKIDYQPPTNPEDWPFVFFVGGDATFNPDGSILDIEQGFVLSTQQHQLETLILKFKPLFTWCGLIVTYV